MQYTKRWDIIGMMGHFETKQWFTVLLFCFLCTVTHSQSAPDYRCPKSCLCATLPDQYDAVQLVCSVLFIGNYSSNFTVIPSNLTTWLTVQCTIDLFTSYIYPYAFSHLNSLEELIIISCKFDVISRDAFKGLTSLRLFRFSTVPQKHAVEFEGGAFSEMPNLESIDIVGGSVAYFPSDIFCGLDKLRTLNLSLNFLTDLNSIGVNFTGDSSQSSNQNIRHCLQNLKVLKLNYNFLSSVPYRLKDRMPRLIELHLQSNQLSTISETAFEGLDLEIVDLSNNLLTLFSAKLFLGLHTLRTLDLSHNRLQYIHHDALSDLYSLESFSLQNNSITSDIFFSGLLQNQTKLKTLDISDNKLHFISHKMFQNLINLETLNLKGNSIREIPKSVFHTLRQLSNLHIQNNRIHIVSAAGLQGLQSLHVLNLADNNIKSLDEKFFVDTPLLTQLNLSGNSLERIPVAVTALPKLQILELSRNRIVFIEASSLQNLSALIGISLKDNKLQSLPFHLFRHNLNLLIINFSKNNISDVEYGTFNGLHKLSHLILDYNEIDDMTLIFSRLTNLVLLSLSYNKITSISAFHFPKNIQVINLAKNRIKDIGLRTFYNLPYLKSVDLSFNDIPQVFSKTTLEIHHNFVTRPNIFLRGNLLSCSCKMHWLKWVNKYNSFRTMNVADLDHILCTTLMDRRYRFIADVSEESFVCLFKQRCDKSECECCSRYDNLTLCHCTHTCPDPCTCYHDHLNLRWVVDCSNKNLTKIPALPTLTTDLLLRNNSIPSVNARDLLGVKSVNVMDLSENRISNIELGAFAELPNLKVLSLDHNSLKELTVEMFYGLISLQTVSVNDNLLSQVGSDAFDSSVFIQTVLLHNNKLTRVWLQNFVEQGTLVKQLTLSGNPWDCGCAFGPAFQHWITAQATIISDARQIECSVESLETESVWYKPLNLSSENETNPSTEVYSTYTASSDNMTQDLAIIRIDFAFCNNITNVTVERTRIETVESKIAITWAVSMSVIFVLMLVLLALILHYREYIKVYIFAHYGIRFTNQKEDKSKFYDAFISFSSDDNPVIISELAEKLENEPPRYKTCIHYRDFVGGANIAEAIVEAVELSKRTIILLSNAFLTSEWCNYEFQTAHHNLLKDKSNRVIIVLLEEVDTDKLSSELKLYMKTNTYLKWGDQWFWDKLHYAMPDVKPDRNSFYDLYALPVEHRPMNLLLPVKKDLPVAV